MSSQTAYAGFWNRFAAVLVDVLILLIPQALFGYLIGMAFVNRMASADPVQNYIGFEIWSRGIALAIAWLYFALLESSKYQATVGKMALGLVVTDLTGNRISFAKASGRFFGKLLSSIILGFGYLMVAFTARKQALHDILSECLVIKKPTTVAADTYSIPDTLQTDDESFYLAAKKELDEKSMRDGLWAKAFSISDGDENKAKARYIQLRVAELSAQEQTRQEEQRLKIEELEREKARKQEEQYEDLCGTCAFFTSTTIIDPYVGKCGKHARKTYTTWGCADFMAK